MPKETQLFPDSSITHKINKTRKNRRNSILRARNTNIYIKVKMP